MQFFHIDDKTFPLGIGEIDCEKIDVGLFDNKFSDLGAGFFLQNHTAFALKDIQGFLYETAFEYIRATEFSQYPSRASCLFACTAAYLPAWRAVLKRSKDGEVALIETQNYLEFDASWFTTIDNRALAVNCQVGSFAHFCIVARKYWGGEISPRPLMEVLVVPPFTCVGFV